MAESLSEIFDRLLQKQAVMVERYHALEDKCKALEGSVADLQSELERQKEKLERTVQENEYLKIVRTVAPDRESLERSREIVAKLVRDVDKCIEDLNEGGGA